ncbi:carboxypeptidase A4-like [Varroa destructor]|uniref:Peptidase M14 domain-containing protein n=1 Tax=Varroa destructor TaxID=109461 RepID=A0A7M7KA13_VARDE|nr:carboxypeptidase A4-like [Varroa destructor]
MRLVLCALLIGTTAGVPLEPCLDNARLLSAADTKPASAKAKSTIKGKDQPCGIQAAPSTFSAEDDNESRPEKIPGHLSQSKANQMSVRLLGHETAHKLSGFDLLMRDQALEEAEKRMKEQQTKNTENKEDISKMPEPASSMKGQPTMVNSKEKIIMNSTCSVSATDANQVVPFYNSENNIKVIASRVFAGGDRALGKPFMNKYMPIKVQPNNKPGKMGKALAVEHLTETTFMKKEEGLVSYSFESDMMTAGKSASRKTPSMPNAVKTDAEEKQADDARTSLKARDKLPIKSAAKIIPSRYSSAVLVEPTTVMDARSEEKGSFVKQETQPSGASVKSKTFTVKSASRQFGSIPERQPYTHERLLHPGEVNSYNGYKVYRAMVGFRSTESFFNELANDESQNVTFWQKPLVGRNVTFIMPTITAQTVEAALKKRKLRYTILTDNLKTWIDAERKELNPNLFLEERNMENFKLNKYHRLDEIYSYLDLLASKYPALVQLVTLGHTYEDNPIRGVVVSTGGNKRAIYIDSGIHASEWISIASGLYLLSSIVSGAKNDTEINTLLDRFDFHFVPVVNPDGYKHSWIGDRLWRKNRVRFQGYHWCAGVDPNRNFGYHWGDEGASANPCAQDYRGPFEFSESESRAVRDYVTSLKGNLSLYMSLHSFGQYLLLPYGAGPLLVSAQHDELMAAGSVFRDAIYKKSGQIYRVGSSKQLLYPASGTSNDWVHSQGVKYAFVAELCDQGDYGFLLPTSQILPTAIELFEGVKAVAKTIASTEL